MQKEEEFKVPAWLKRIQEASWEPEILISGIVLFGLFKIYPLIGDLNYFLEMNSSKMFSNGTVNEVFTSILKFANIILIIGFLSHILLRSVWAAFVGLSYVYKSGIKYQKLNYPDKYLRLVEKSGDYRRQIIALEKVCSVIFAFSFLVFMWLVGLSVFFLIIASGIGIFQTIFPGNYDYSVLNYTLITFFIIVFIDFISLGGLRKIPYTNKVYYPIHLVASWLTLSFLYRNIYYGLITNHKKWVISLILIIFSLAAFFSVQSLNSKGFVLGRAIALVPTDEKYRLDENQYRSEVDDGVYSKYMHIGDYVVEEDYLELFIVHTSRYEQNWIFPACDYEKFKENPDINPDSLKMNCLEKFYGVALDGKLLEDDFVYQRRSQTGQDGLLSIVDISHLKKGKHKLELYYDFYNQEKDTIFHNKVKELVFYKVMQK
ncbi:hypothetical protein [Mangrovivirga cuniculi]|uniref:Uncharacterized protein n=1 Tax=Mangrovivirga cuniculi TaxID=2715131 RepID=A0A4D7JLS7_9BACT|nr:hypothetical protein [Mangrovivirga cuniculi]QCK16541.1 hypothetical protein DCC35_18295 [Mangrovivirga cuniculi]